MKGERRGRGSRMKGEKRGREENERREEREREENERMAKRGNERIGDWKREMKERSETSVPFTVLFTVAHAYCLSF